MKINIIALTASKNSGKTNTLNYLILKLFNDNYSIVYSNKTISNLKTNKDIEDFCSIDRIVDFEINSKVIRIITFGDSQNLMKSAFDKSKSVDLYVCASRSKGSTCNYIKEQAGDNTILWHKKWKTTSSDNLEKLNEFQKRINQLQANELYTEILEIL